MAVGKYTPNIAVQGDMGWVAPQVRARFKDMNEDRLNKKDFKWGINRGENMCRNWYFKFKTHLSLLGLDFILNDNVTYTKKFITENICKKEFELFKRNWSNELNNVERANGSHSKLRTYKMFKSEYETENYLTVSLPIRHRSALAKFKCGVAPIRIETGRYDRLPLESRLCSQCIQ